MKSKRKKHRFHVKIKLIKKSGSYAMLWGAKEDEEKYDDDKKQSENAVCAIDFYLLIISYFFAQSIIFT